MFRCEALPFDGMKRCVLMPGTGGGRARPRKRIGVSTPIRSIDRTVSSGTGSYARPVRAALPLAYARKRERVFRDDVSSEARVTKHDFVVAGSNPARQPLDSSDG